MSTRLSAVKEKLILIKSSLAAAGDKSRYSANLMIRIDKAINILTENESKIWLRTRVGEPMLKELQDAVDDAYKSLEGGFAASEGFEVALKKVEDKAAKIDEESQRRNMVVT